MDGTIDTTNYSWYCTKCKKFRTMKETHLKSDDGRVGVLPRLCDVCNKKVGWSCQNVLNHKQNGIEHWMDEKDIRQCDEGLTKLSDVCYNCTRRFKCYTLSS